MSQRRLIYKLKTNYAVRVNSCDCCVVFTVTCHLNCFEGVPEDLGLDDKESAVEMMGEEEAQFDNDMIDLNIPMEEEVNEEFSIEENKMDEMIEMDEDEQTLVDKSKDIGEAEDESIVSSKTDSVQTFESLPMKKMCSVIKLKNKFNFFDRSASTEKVVQRVRECS